MPTNLSLSSSASAGSYINQLPRELIDQIIFHLVRSQNLTDATMATKSIAACSLTSRMFIPSCRHAMFAFNSSTKVGYDDEEMEGLIDLIDTPVQTIGIGLRRVRFVTGTKMDRGNRRRGRSPLGRMKGGRSVFEITQRVREVLKNVESIHLEDNPPTYVCSGVESTFWKLIDALRGVKEVQVGARDLMGNVKLLEWVCELPELEELSVVSSTTEIKRQESGLRNVGTVRSQKLTSANKMSATLEIGGPEELSILRWLLAQSPVPCIRSMRVRSPLRGCWGDEQHEDGVQLVKRFFQVCGSGIGHLCVVVPEEGDFGDVLEEVMGLDHCDNLHSIHIEGIRVGPESAAGEGQRRALEMLFEKMFVESSVGPRVNTVTLTVQVDPHSREAFAFFGLSDVALFKDFKWGRVPEILERVWLSSCGRNSRCQSHGQAAAEGGGEWSYQSASSHRSREIAANARKELVMIIQGGSKYGRERLVDVLRRGVFHAFDEKGEFLVQFEAEGTQRRNRSFL